MRACLRSLHYTNTVPEIQPFWKWLGKQAEVQRRSCTEPRVNFLLGFLIKSCGELYYLDVFLEWVKGTGHIWSGKVVSGESYQWRNWTLTASDVKDCCILSTLCWGWLRETWIPKRFILSNACLCSLGLWAVICSFVNFVPGMWEGTYEI